MAVDPNIKKKADDIRNKIYGKEVRESLASGLEAMSSDVVENEVRQSVVEGRQDSVESQWQAVSDEMTDKDVISAPEIIAARDGEANLKARLDKENQEVTAQLDQNTQDILNMQVEDFEQFELAYPPNRPNFASVKPPFRVYRDINGTIKHDFDFDTLENNAGHVYVSGYTGSDSNDGLSPSTPLRLLRDAMNVVLSLSNDTVVLHFLDNLLDDSRMGSTYEWTLNKDVVWKSDAPSGKTFIYAGSGTSLPSFNWEQDGLAYKATRSGTILDVFDTSVIEDGISKRYKKRNSVSQVKAEKGTWYSDGSSVWVRTAEDKEPGNDLAVGLGKPFPLKLNIANYKFITRDMEFYTNSTNDDALSVHADDVSGEYWNENCVFGGSLVRNGLSTVGVLKTYSFNPILLDNALDGANYHALTNSVDTRNYAFEYNLKSFKHGEPGTSNANATTAHEGYTVLRINSEGHDTYGPVLADVQSCYSVCYDCVMYNSKLETPSHPNKAAFNFSISGGVKDGAAYLFNSAGGGEDTWSIASSVDFPVYIKDFKGRNIHPNTDLNIV